MIIEPKYKPLTNDQKLAVREFQFQLVTLKEKFKQLEQKLYTTVQGFATEQGIASDAKVTFQMETLEFVDQP